MEAVKVGDGRILASMSTYDAIKTIEALEAAGATEKLFRHIRSNKEVAKTMVASGLAFVLANSPKKELESQISECAGEE